MNNTRKIFLCLLFIIPLLTRGQNPQVDSLKNVISKSSPDTNKVKTLIELSKKLRSSDPQQSLANAKQALALSEELNYDWGKASGHKWIGMYYYDKTDWAPALENWEKSLAIFQHAKDNEGIASITNNLASIYWVTGRQGKALELFMIALDASEKTGDNFRLATTLQNIGVIYMEDKNTYSDALTYLKRALGYAEKISDKNNISSCNVNIGETYMKMGDDSTALYYFARAKKVAESNDDFNLPYILFQLGEVMKRRGDYPTALRWYKESYSKAKTQSDQTRMAQAANGIGEIYRLQKQPRDAINYFMLGDSLSQKSNTPGFQKNSFHGLAASFSELADYYNAYNYLLRYSNLSDSLNQYSADSIRTKFAVSMKQNQIDLLSKEKKLGEEELRRQKLVRNAFLVGFALVSMLIFILYRDYRNKIKTNKLLDQRKAEIEALLLNILPHEVAMELQKEGHATPRYYESVSVMFTDFVSFSKIAETLTPQQIVEELNEFFIEMDEIIDRYHLEKIKTIGDSYMCAGGIPTPNNTHPVQMVRAGLDIVEYLGKKNKQREDAGLAKWEIRIGIHTGPLVAGVVGKKKYAYDIWGSTVNIASRMESNGEPGLLNISAATHELIKDKFDCTYRGKIYAKNVGEIDMYFVRDEIGKRSSTTKAGSAVQSS